MIQRIQSLYILISVALVGFLFELPFAEILSDNNLYLFDIRGIVREGKIEHSGLAITIFVGIILVLHVAAFILYKKRILQIRILTFSIIIMLGLFGMFYFFTYYTFNGADVSFKIAVAFPLVAIILDYLAIRNIGKDEALVRSIDRIR
ncbi:MAG TPA: DUF4293 domain-containing protein [Sunxiuqinia sp.]|nr:DUF4293 domain-containing protein [Sunxiuqinia sp.]